MLVRRLKAGGDRDGPLNASAERVLNLARVLAHVKEHDPRKRPMESAREPKSKESADYPRLSEVRFRRLLATDAGEAQVDAFRRLVTLLDGRVNVASLGYDFVNWGHPYRGDRVRQRWAFDYYDAYSALPSASTTITDEDEA